MADRGPPLLEVTVVYSPRAREVHERQIQLPDGSTAGQALRVSGLIEQFPELAAAECVVGIWGRKARPGQILRARDRLEIYRALAVDPNVARRQRFVKQGVRTAGLFTSKTAKPVADT